jgi:hypothetical protein
VTSKFDPSAPSIQSYMFVYARRDVADRTFPPTVPDDCLFRLQQVLAMFPTTERGRMDEDYEYNIVGSGDELCNATKMDISQLRQVLMLSNRESRESTDSLHEDTLRFQNRVNTGFTDILAAVEASQIAMISMQEAAVVHGDLQKKTNKRLKELIGLQKASDAKYEEVTKVLLGITKKLGRLYFSLFMFVTNVCVPFLPSLKCFAILNTLIALSNIRQKWRKHQQIF